MKKIFLLLVLMTVGISISAQTMMVYQKTGKVTEFEVASIDSVVFRNNDNTDTETNSLIGTWKYVTGLESLHGDGYIYYMRFDEDGTFYQYCESEYEAGQYTYEDNYVYVFAIPGWLSSEARVVEMTSTKLVLSAFGFRITYERESDDYFADYINSHPKGVKRRLLL